ncbi:hypothetical protein ACN38_g10032 [Penicillium nordicum]|uniref:Uncharacterized protein n=1 Tax=Penicillium nordicum TaxID=229535 RepID=A0A0M9WC01_9EURO|nr:hypothetical protein ACN38_g10032 [Penicillium nordicum]
MLVDTSLFSCEFDHVHYVLSERVLQPAPGLASYKLGQKTTISEHYAQIDQAPIYIVHDMTEGYCCVVGIRRSSLRLHPEHIDQDVAEGLEEPLEL